MKKRRVENTIS